MQEKGENATFFVAVHVGAGYHSPSNEKALKSAVKLACVAAGSILRKGSGRCIDAVTAVIQVLEDDSSTNAGRGSNLIEDGHVECDASTMDGNSGVFRAVGAIPGVRNPIQVAALLAKEQMMGSPLFGRIPPIFLVGEGARAWAKSKGLALAAGTAADDQEIFSSWTHKTEHFQRIHATTGVPFTEMLFFDDEDRNIQTVSKMGVTSILVGNGVNLGALRQGLSEFARKSASSSRS